MADLTLHLTLAATGGAAVWQGLTGPGLLPPGATPTGTPIQLAGAWLDEHELGGGRAFCPDAPAVVGDRLRSLGANSARVVLDVRRQDRLMEHGHLAVVRAGGVVDFAEQFADPPDPVFDWGALAERIAGVPGVAEVIVRPVELYAEWPGQLAAHLLRIAGVTGLTPVRAPSEPTWTERGIRVARAMNAHLISDAERELVREFVAGLFPGPETGNLFLDDALRAGVLAGYAEVNRKMFRTWLPELPEDAYLDDDRTAALATRKNQESRP